MALNRGMADTYARRLAKAIEDSKQTQAQVAKAAGTTQQVISGIIKRNSAGSLLTAQLARACGVDAYWLATGKGNPHPATGADLSVTALELARTWGKLPPFKQRGYLQAIMTDAAVLEVFPELQEAMLAAAIATDPDYHKMTEKFGRSRAQIQRQGELDLKQ